MRKAWLSEATVELAKAGVASPAVDAEALLLHVLGIAKSRLVVDEDQPLGAAEKARLDPLLKRRVTREPLQYILGQAAFHHVELEIGPGVLVPRPETEILVEKALAVLPADRSAHVLDLGTGSGAIALALAVARPLIEVDAVEISEAARTIAQGNIRRLNLEKRIQILAGDLFAALPSQPSREAFYDVIVSNPPYVASCEWTALPPEVKDYEPRQALDGGAEGMDIHRRILDEAPRFLRKGGFLFLEIGAEQGPAVLAHGRLNVFYRHLEILSDLNGLPRVFKAVC